MAAETRGWLKGQVKVEAFLEEGALVGLEGTSRAEEGRGASSGWALCEQASLWAVRTPPLPWVLQEPQQNGRERGPE